MKSGLLNPSGAAGTAVHITLDGLNAKPLYLCILKNLMVVESRTAKKKYNDVLIGLIVLQSSKLRMCYAVFFL